MALAEARTDLPMMFLTKLDTDHLIDWILTQIREESSLS